MPKNNEWSLIGAAAAVVISFVLTALLNFFATGNEWPTTTQGWAKIVLPALCAGLAAIFIPHYSVSEQRTGQRIIDSVHDAPVLDKSDPIRLAALAVSPSITSTSSAVHFNRPPERHDPGVVDPFDKHKGSSSAAPPAPPQSLS